MKTKISKKTLSVLLALFLLLTPVLSVFAFADTQKIERDCPYVYVHGFLASDIYKDVDNPDAGKLWDFDTDTILESVKSLLPSFAQLAINKDYDALYEAIMPVLEDLFGDSIVDGDGMAHDNSGVILKYPTKEDIKENTNFNFKYDWRVDPMECAKQLNDYIEYICELTGSEQITLECHSLGGVVTLSYLTMYGNSRIKSLCWNTTAINGETYTGELLTGKIKINSPALLEYIRYLVDGTEYESLLDGVITTFANAGLMDVITDLGNDIITNLYDRILPEFGLPLFAGWLSIWDMVPDKDIEAAKEYVFETIYKGDNASRQGLIDRIDAYTETVRKQRTETLNALNEKANVYVLTRYGYSSVPITPSYNILSDGVIDTAFSSFGATTAEYGKTLSEDYLAGADANYISPDKMIDASTCLFPDQTWFVRNFKHSLCCNAVDTMILKLLYTDGQATVKTYQEYPQFLTYDSVSDSISATTPTTQTKETFKDKFRKFFSQCIGWLNSILDMLLNLSFGDK